MWYGIMGMSFLQEQQKTLLSVALEYRLTYLLKSLAHTWMEGGVCVCVCACVCVCVCLLLVLFCRFCDFWCLS